MFSSLFIGKADYISAVAREIFPLFGPVAPLEALLESGQCTLRLAELRTALADEAMLDLAFDPKSEEPWSDAVRLRVEAYTDGLVDALCAQHVPSDRIVCQVARHGACFRRRDGRCLAREAGHSLEDGGRGRPRLHAPAASLPRPSLAGTRRRRHPLPPRPPGPPVLCSSRPCLTYLDD